MVSGKKTLNYLDIVHIMCGLIWSQNALELTTSFVLLDIH